MTDAPNADSVRLLPAEKLALTVALAQVRRGESPQPNTATLCVLALARLQGDYDWTNAPAQIDGSGAS